MNAAYALSPRIHGWVLSDDAPYWLVRDGGVPHDNLDIEARVRSGDYMAALATELDRINQSLRAARPNEHEELERLVAELLYVDRTYTLTKK